MQKNSQLRIGVTLHYRDDQQSIWENGIFQNCFFLIQLLKKIPEVEFACLLIDREESVRLPDALWMDTLNLSVLGLNDGMEQLNIVIEMSALLPDEWAHSFRNKGGRYYWMRVGNDYFLDVERAIYNKSRLPSLAIKCMMLSGHFQNMKKVAKITLNLHPVLQYS